MIQIYKLNMIPHAEREHRGYIPPKVHVSQYDKGLRTLVFELYEGNTCYTIPNNATAKIYGKKPDKNVFEYEMTIDATGYVPTVSVDLREQMTPIAGIVQCEVRIIVDTDTVGTANFVICVEPAPVGAEEAYSESEIPEIDNLLYGGEVGDVFTKTKTGARWDKIGTDSGLMMKSEYDPNDDGSVLKADHADDADTVDGHTVSRDVLAGEYTNTQIDEAIGRVQHDVDDVSDQIDAQLGQFTVSRNVLADEYTNAQIDGAIQTVTDAVSQLDGVAVKSVNNVAPVDGNVALAKSDIGLGNVDNTSDLNKPISTAVQNALDLKANTALIGAANGIAELDSNGFVPAAQLPSYVDDILEFASMSAFPATGETGKIYVALDTNLTYRWGGSEYVEISQSLALGETSGTAYRGDRGKAAYDHSQIISGNPHHVTATDVGLGNVNNTADADKPISTATQSALDQKMTKSVYDSNGNGVVDNAEKVDGHTVGRDVESDEYTNEQIDEMHGTMLDSTFAAMLDMTNTTSIFKAWYAQASKDESNRYALLERFADMMASACGDITFTLRNYQPSVSSDPAMTPMDDLAQHSAGQLCTENTTPVADWTDEHPIGGWYIRAQALSLQNGKMNVIAIEGIDDSFDVTGESAPVYCFCMSPWIKEWSDDNYEYTSFRGTQDASESYRPMAEAVDFVDNSKRNLTWHPAYGGGRNSAGALTSGSGRPAWNFQSANSGISNARKMSAYEGLWNDCDTEFILKMWQLRHFNLENSGIAEGCTSYSYQYDAAVAETGVKRVLLTTAQAANLVVGSTVSVGEMGTNTSKDRGNAYMRNLADSVKISSIENVDVDGTTYAAVNLDTSVTFDTTSTTVISTWPWISGATDALPGHKDGCFHSLTDGKGPLRVMGIEILNGACVNGLDPLWNVVDGEYQIYTCRDSEKQAGSITADYEKVLTQPALVTSSSWQYIKHLIKNALGVVFPDAVGGSSTTYFKSAFYWWYSTGVRSPWRFFYLITGGPAGLAGATGDLPPGFTSWTVVPRLSGSGKKRGEWSA